MRRGCRSSSHGACRPTVTRGERWLRIGFVHSASRGWRWQATETGSTIGWGVLPSPSGWSKGPRASARWVCPRRTARSKSVLGEPPASRAETNPQRAEAPRNRGPLSCRLETERAYARRLEVHVSAAHAATRHGGRRLLGLLRDQR